MKRGRTGWEYFLRQRDEILDYKWLESEKLGSDIGIDRAIREWLQKHHSLWAPAQSDCPLVALKQNVGGSPVAAPRQSADIAHRLTRGMQQLLHGVLSGRNLCQYQRQLKNGSSCGGGHRICWKWGAGIRAAAYLLRLPQKMGRSSDAAA